MRKSPSSYGIVVSQSFSSYLHTGQESYIDPFDNGRKVQDQVAWMIKKGDLILSNKAKHEQIVFCRRFRARDPKVFINRFVSYVGDDAPQSLQDIPAGASPQFTLIRGSKLIVTQHK
jgi:hypothetical protein